MSNNHIQIRSVNNIRYTFGSIWNLLVHFITSRFITKSSKVSIITNVSISSVSGSKRENLLASSLILHFANLYQSKSIFINLNVLHTSLPLDSKLQLKTVHVPLFKTEKGSLENEKVKILIRL